MTLADATYETQERAAIYEFLAGMSRVDAERRALQEAHA